MLEAKICYVIKLSFIITTLSKKNIELSSLRCYYGVQVMNAASLM